LLPPSVRNQPGCRFAACDFASAMKITIVLGAFLPVPPVNGWPIASGKRREPSGRSIRAITPRRICRLETPNCWFDGFQGGAEKVKLICANCDEARPWRATESFFAGQSSKQQFWKESFGLREFLLIHRWPRAAKLLVSRRSKP